MKKIFNVSFVVVLFMLGVFLLSSHKVDAAVTVTVTANGQTSLNVAYSETVPVTIEWNSTGAVSCSNNFNSSIATSGTYPYMPKAGKTFSVTCRDAVPTTTACYIGYYEEPDPVHPNGGTVTYTGADSVVYKESGIWNDMSAVITYKTGTSPSAVGAHTTTCPTGSWSYPSACPTYCGYSGGTQTQTCTGGNSLCDGKAASRYCSATAACPTTGSCKGGIVAGSTNCDGTGGSGPDEGVSCSYFTTKESCQPSSCSSWYHHGCSWSTVAI